MRRSRITSRVVAVFAVGGVVAISQLAGVGSATAASATTDDDCGYAGSIVTATQLTLDHEKARPGQANTAHATVSSDVGTPPGMVTFRVRGHAASTVALSSAGTASYAIPTDLSGGAYRVTARYSGAKCFQPSGDSAAVTVKVPTAPRPAPTAGGLPSVGADSDTQLYGLLGLGLVGAGALTLALRRRQRARG